MPSLFPRFDSTKINGHPYPLYLIGPLLACAAPLAALQLARTYLPLVRLIFLTTSVPGCPDRSREVRSSNSPLSPIPSGDLI